MEISQVLRRTMVWSNKKKGEAQTHRTSLPREVKISAIGRYDMRGHWSRTCRMPKHLVDLYQASQKEKRKNVETNFVHINDPVKFVRNHEREAK